MAKIFVQLVVLCALATTLLLAVGCEKTKEISGAIGASQGSNAGGSKASGDGDRITIDELLARTDLTDAVRATLKRSKELGQESFSRDNAEMIIKNSYSHEKPELVEVKTRHDSKSVALPSLARYEGPVDHSFPDDVLSFSAYLKEQHKLALVGIEHFKSRPVYDLSDATRQSCVKWMERVFKTLPYAGSLPTWEALSREGIELQKQCKGLPDEPMFCLCSGVVAGELKDQSVALEFLTRATENFSVSRYPTRLPILCYRYLDIYVTLLKRDGYDGQVAAFKHWIGDDIRASGHDQRFLLLDIIKWIDLMYLNKDLAAIREFWGSVTESKLLTPWLREMTMANLNYQTGFYYRGNGYADSVTEEGWEKLKLYCGEAHKHFEKALEINPRFPEAATGLMSIASMGYSDKDEEEWFEQAIKFETDYLQAYRVRQSRLRKRWGGSPQEQLDFFMEQSKKNDSGTIAFLLPESLFRLRWQEEMKPKEWVEFISKPKVATQVIAVLDKILATDEEVVGKARIQNRDFFLTVKAYFASKAGLYEVAEGTFDELDGRMNKDAVNQLGLKGGDIELLRSIAYAFTCEYQDRARELSQLLGTTFEDRTKNRDEILELTDGLSQWVDSHSGGLYFKQARERALLEAKYASGEQVDLIFDENFTIWNSADFTQFKSLPPTTVMLDNRSRDPKCALILDAVTPGNKVLAADFELPADDLEIGEGINTSLFCPSIVMGSILYEKTQEKQAFAVGISRTPKNELTDTKIGNALSGKICFGSNDFRIPLFQYYFDLKPGKNRVKVFFGNKYFEIYVNDQFVCRSFSKRFLPTDRIQIAQPGSANGRGTAKVSNLTLQCWHAGPPPTVERDAEALIDYYTKASEAAPQERWPVFWLAHALHLKKDYEAAIPQYEKAIEMGVTPRFAGFYLGDALARAGQYRQAMTWYEKVVDPKAASCPVLRNDSKNHVTSNGSTLNWAAFRLQWASATQPARVPQESEPLASPSKIRPSSVVEGPKFSAIALALKKASDRAPKRTLGNIDRTIKFYQRNDAQKDVERLSPLLDKVAKGQPYVPYIESESDKPLYLEFENREKLLFQHFERRHLHFHWRHFYEPLVKH